MPVAVTPAVDAAAPLTFSSEAERLAAAQRVMAELQPDIEAIERTEAALPYLKFQPNPAQYQWLQMIQKGVDEGKMKFGIFPGNGQGKSRWVTELLQNIMCPAEERNPWFDVPFIRNWKWPKVIRLIGRADDFKDMTGVIWNLIQSSWPKYDYDQLKQEHPYVAAWVHKRTKFRLAIRTYDQPVEAHDDGETMGMLIANEPPPAAIWNCYPSRLRGGGIMIAACTLVRESAFFKTDVIDNPDAVYTLGDVHSGNCSKCAHLEVEHRGKKVQLKGYLDHDALEATIRNAPWHEQEARRSGRPVHLSGAAFPVVPSVHFVPASKTPKLEDCVASILTLDPHQRKPWAIAVDVIDKHDRYWRVDEWPKIDTLPWKLPYHKISNAGVGYEVYVDAIRRLKSKWGVKDINCVIDAKFAGQLVTKDETAQKLREILSQKYRLYFQSGHTAVRGENGGIDILKQYLFFDQSKPVDYMNSPRYFMSDDCWNSKYQVENITWDEKASPDEYGVKETLDEKLLDFVRLMMYAIMHRESRYTPKPTKQEFEHKNMEDAWRRVSAKFPERQSQPVDYEEYLNVT